MAVLRNSLLVFIAVIVALWVIGWGKNDGHLFGDPLLARDMVYAGHAFVTEPLATYGLPVYHAGAVPYTHLTPGPEWIQGVFALAEGNAISYRWHWMATAALSFLTLFWTRRSLVRLGGAPDAAWAGVLFVAATPAFIIYSTHPYCAATLLANAIALAAAASCADRRWPNALVRMALALFAAFWLGLMPVVSAAIWMVTAVVRFSERGTRRVRLMTFAGAALIVIVVSIALKYLQSVALLGSFGAATADFRHILEMRAGVGLRHGALEQIRIALFRFVYLFGFAVVLIPLLLRRNRESRREWPLMAGFVAGGLAWQFIMRGHAEFHAYLMREAMVPVALVLALAATTRGSVRAVLWTAFAEAACVLAVLVIPLVVTGQPLWQIVLQRL